MYGCQSLEVTGEEIREEFTKVLIFLLREPACLLHRENVKRESVGEVGECRVTGVYV